MSFVGVGIIGILTLLLGLFFFLLHIAVCVWGYNDARRKGRDLRSWLCWACCSSLMLIRVISMHAYHGCHNRDGDA